MENLTTDHRPLIMLKQIKSHFALMLLFVITVGLYYSSLLNSGAPITVDDSTVMHHLFNHEMQLAEVFNPGWQKKYYRPIIDLSFFIDQKMYGNSSSGFRLTNLITHAFNVMLLYLTARLLLWNERRRDGIALFAATIFAVQPLAVESVSWISGRTDPIATFWSLLAILTYLYARHYRRWYLLIPSLLFTLIAILSKEVALATPIIIAAFEVFYGRKFGYDRGKLAIPLVITFILAITSYLFLRSLLLSGGDLGLGMIIEKLLSKDLFSALELFFASYGFYLKKLVFPFPINFMINDINVLLYAPLGLLAIIFFSIMVFFKKARRYHFFFLWIMLGIGPAALISFTDIAWTRWAERYLYYSMVPFSMIVAMLVFPFADRASYKQKYAIYPLIVLVLLCLASASFYRSRLMNDNLGIWADSYKKSPSFKSAAVGYAAALAKDGKTEKAEEILSEAQVLGGAQHLLFFNRGHISRKKGNYNDAKDYYLLALQEAREDKRLVTVGPSFRSQILTSLAELEFWQGEKSEVVGGKRLYYREGINYLLEANKESGSSFALYRAAKRCIIIGEKGRAAKYLEMFISKSGDGHYRSAAEKMLKKLSGE